MKHYNKQPIRKNVVMLMFISLFLLLLKLWNYLTVFENVM